MTVATRADVNREAVLAYLNGHRGDLLRDDAVFTSLTTGQQWIGRDAIGGMLNWFYHEALDAQVEDSELIADDDKVVLLGVVVGRHTGTFAGVEATGKPIRMALVVIYDMADGTIARGRVLFDAAAFLAQVQ
jgi:predicted ester cyclase